ncbi:FtsW/RodA/SpoVE family cell cycle protein [Paenibacillus sp. N3.4]|uniref:FtsW/RodA/SpoVE family cell cycle protein n=1 Tax=Paenibacillus sp. N3.4 TaxID=2603222 RepID=UPI0011CBFE0E|nr:FtsW/RodA/SpoVE family cell cycle protein [Paenibacillus sp. N3.4]TXK70634.1 FtsW/RodA/SpoVE family cell cycle protein [Paenibacillus sp. N3.4]
MIVDVREDERVQRYLSEVCEQVRASEVHRDIRWELESHLQDLVDAKLEKDCSFNQAVEESLSELGDPEQIGRGLHKVHKPKMEWGLLAIVVMFLGMALFAIFAVETSMSSMRGMAQLLFEHELIFVSLGFMVLIGFYFMDYRKMERWAWGIMALPFVLALLVHIVGEQVNGQKVLHIKNMVIDVPLISICCFVIGSAALYTRKHTSNGSIWTRLALFVVYPSILFISLHSFSSMIVYMTAFVSIQLVMGTLRKEVFGALFIWIFLGLCYLLRQPYILARMTVFLRPTENSQDMNYMAVQSMMSIRSAGWWGHGFGIVNKSLPEIHTEMLFTYLIYAHGWMAGILIVLSSLLLVSRLIRTGSCVRDPFGRAIILGFTAVIAVQFIWTFAMSVGWLPITGFQMPFLSYGGSHLVLTCACMGCILSVYRKKDRISRLAGMNIRRS